MKFNQYIHILLVAGSALVALLILNASGSRGFLFFVAKYSPISLAFPNDEGSGQFLSSGKCIRFWL
ncbi:TPA: hypothetical protein PXM42_001531 [Yersinia enterocolitica]|uniref:hypothetical protein n=1 Tax=Yersinia enterocolitica TaxID=630 RepID=UPI0033125192|nr:hypothetical protein [Yersinia enterocolitica]